MGHLHVEYARQEPTNQSVQTTRGRQLPDTPSAAKSQVPSILLHKMATNAQNKGYLDTTRLETMYTVTNTWPL